jgi:hypothetical protein
LAEQNTSLMRPLLQVETEHFTTFEPHAMGLRHMEQTRPEGAAEDMAADFNHVRPPDARVPQPPRRGRG